MRRFIVSLLLWLSAFCLIFEAAALDLDFKKGLDDWKTVGGDWKIKDNVLVGTTAGYQDLFLNVKGADKWTDYTVEVKGKLIAGRIWGVCFRYKDTNTNYRLNLYDDLDAANNLYIYKRVGGAFSEVRAVPVGRIDKDTWYTLNLSITGGAMKAYLNNELKIEVEDKANVIDEGTIALEGEGGTTFHVEYVKIEGKGIPSSKTAVEPTCKLATLWGALKR
jgi:hypothetical protein